MGRRTIEIKYNTTAYGGVVECRKKTCDSIYGTVQVLYVKAS